MAVKQAKTRKTARANGLSTIFFPTPRVAFFWLLFAISVFGVVKAGRFLVNRTAFFRIGRIEVVGNHYLTRKTILKLAECDSSGTLFQMELPEISKRILSNPYVKGVSVTRALPATLLISVQEREPVLYLVDRIIYMVDNTGLIIKKLPAMPMGSVPIVTGLSVKELRKDKKPLFKALSLKKKIQEVDNTLLSFISEIHIRKDGSPELYLVKGGARVRLGNSHHYERLYVLSELLNTTSIINQLPQLKRIDLTFENRVVLQKKKHKT